METLPLDTTKIPKSMGTFASSLEKLFRRNSKVHMTLNKRQIERDVKVHNAIY